MLKGPRTGNGYKVRIQLQVGYQGYLGNSYSFHMHLPGSRNSALLSLHSKPSKTEQFKVPSADWEHLSVLGTWAKCKSSAPRTPSTTHTHPNCLDQQVTVCTFKCEKHSCTKWKAQDRTECLKITNSPLRVKAHKNHGKKGKNLPLAHVFFRAGV